MRIETERNTRLVGGESRGEPRVVDGWMGLRAIVALPFPADIAAGFSSDRRGSEHGIQIKSGVGTHLIEEIGPTNGGVKRRQSELGE
jgi:hypothetical protein